MAGGLGFEPRQADPESAVLPLHHPPIASVIGDKQPAVRAQQQREEASHCPPVTDHWSLNYITRGEERDWQGDA